MMRYLPYSILLALGIISNSFAILDNDAYHIDYHYELLGLPLQDTTFFFRPRKDDKATLLYTFSDLNVIGAIIPGSGKLVWRQALGNDNRKRFLRGIDGEDAIVSGVGNRIDCWDATSGILKWDQRFNGVLRDFEVIETSKENKFGTKLLALFEEDGKGVIRLMESHTGHIVWQFSESNSYIPCRISGNSEDIFLLSLQGVKDGYNLRVTVVDPENGKRRGEYSLVSNSDVHSSDDLIVKGTNLATPIIAWIDKSKKNVKVNILSRTSFNTNILPIDNAEIDIEKVSIYAPNTSKSPPHFLIHAESEKSSKVDVYHVNPKNGIVKKAYELGRISTRSAISISCVDSSIFFTRVTEDEIIIMSSTSEEQIGKWPVKTKSRGEFLHTASEIVKRSENSYAVRSAVLTASEAYIMIRNGVESWVRFEGLSGAVAAEWAEIPRKQGLAATLYAEGHRNIIQAYVHRVKRHIRDLRYLPDYIQNLPRRILSGILSTNLNSKSDGLVRDNFGFNKFVLVATLRGSIYALESNNQGSIIWFLKAFKISSTDKWDVKKIWVDNTKGVASVYGVNGEFLLFNSSTGSIIERVESSSNSLFTNIAVVKNTEGKWLLLPFSLNGTSKTVSSEEVPSSLLITRGINGEIQGVAFESKLNTTSAILTWEFQPSSGQKIINVVSRPIHDPVASIGRVLGDRNVLYKYLNPNTVLVTAVSDLTHTASFYLLDSASGEVIYSVTHEGVDTKQPITSALTENWLVYSLWSDVKSDSSELPASKGYQIIVSELFESEFPNDRGPLGSAENFSSLEPSDEPNPEPALPYVITQSFMIPEPINHMTVTQTRQGITSRQLICSLPLSNALIGIPYTMLDPRKPVGLPPTPLEVEEGLIQYQPFIDFHPNLIITHEREVIGIRGVISSPSLLESTSLIFAYGIDIFGTRVAPSFAFDLLGNNFNKLSLVATILALTAGVAILAPIAKRKQINGIWTAS